MRSKLISIVPTTFFGVSRVGLFFAMNQKPYKTISELIQMMIDRGLNVDDKQQLEVFLSMVSYYHFSGYFRCFQIGPNFEDFKPNTHSDYLIKIYQFDIEFRSLINKYLEIVELEIRTIIIDKLGNPQKCGPLFYLDEQFFIDPDEHQEFHAALDEDLQRALISRNLIAMHFKEDFQALPVWGALEFITMGGLSKFYSNLKRPYQKVISNNNFFTMSPKLLSSILHLITILRNSCSHRERLYHKFFPCNVTYSKDEEKLFSSINYNYPKKSFSTVFVIIYELNKLLPTEWKMKLKNDLKRLFEDNASLIDPQDDYGFPKKWKDLL